MKALVCADLQRLLRALPNVLRSRAEALRLGPPPYVLVRFDAEEVVLSGRAAKALRVASEHEGTAVVAGGNFTAEARSLAVAHGAQIVDRSDFHWTDESYQAIRRP